MMRAEANRKLSEASNILAELEKDAKEEGLKGLEAEMRRLKEDIRGWLI